MAQQHTIPITNGKGSKEIVNGQYNVTAKATGYDNSTINPKQVNITTGTDTYAFTIAATGTLTLHVSDDGTAIGVPIEGAIFYRCDAQEKNYGNPIETDDQGNAVFEHVPFDATNPPLIYFKQVASDGAHTFDDTLQNTTLTTANKTLEIQNPDADIRNFTLTDANYANLPIADGEILLNL